jgi:hypothetical protein
MENEISHMVGVVDTLQHVFDRGWKESRPLPPHVHQADVERKEPGGHDDGPVGFRPAASDGDAQQRQRSQLEDLLAYAADGISQAHAWTGVYPEDREECVEDADKKIQGGDRGYDAAKTLVPVQPQQSGQQQQKASLNEEVVNHIGRLAPVGRQNIRVFRRTTGVTPRAYRGSL